MKYDMKTELVLGTVAMLIALPAFGEPNPDRDVFYGETHVHTSWSFDAYIFGNTVTTPADAYKYAKGEPIMHPMGYEIKITTPLDWMGVTDHSEYVGVIQEANDPNSLLSAAAQRASDGNQTDQGSIRDPPVAVAERRIRQLRNPVLFAR